MGDNNNSKKYQIIKVIWYTSISIVGIVAIKSFNDTWKAYIGTPDKFIGGLDEKSDSLYIAKYGCKLSKKTAVFFFPDLDPKKYNE